MGARFGFFMLGGVVGAIAAALLTPYTGKEARSIVADKANDLFGNAQDWGDQAATGAQSFYRQAAATGQRVVSAVVDRGQDVINNVQQAANNAKPVFAEKSGELRDKIEEARQRIAAQVAKNAGEDVSDADEVISADYVDIADADGSVSAGNIKDSIEKDGE